MNFNELKLEIFIPKSHLPALRLALQSVGAGRLGNYDSCLSYSRVTASWRPLHGSRPYLGTEGEVSEAEEKQPDTPLGKDVWCCSDDGQSFYLDSQSINAENLPRGMSYRVAVKEVRDSDGSLEQIIICGFESQNDVLVCSIFDQSAGLWNPVSIREYPALKGVWEIMKPYMKEKRISYSDSWMWDKKA